jgi:hypothetical protein
MMAHLFERHVDRVVLPGLGPDLVHVAGSGKEVVAILEKRCKRIRGKNLANKPEGLCADITIFTDRFNPIFVVRHFQMWYVTSLSDVVQHFWILCNTFRCCATLSDVVQHFQMWYVTSLSDVVQHFQMLCNTFRCCATLSDVVQHFQMLCNTFRCCTTQFSLVHICWIV